MPFSSEAGESNMKGSLRFFRRHFPNINYVIMNYSQNNINYDYLESVFKIKYRFASKSIQTEIYKKINVLSGCNFEIFSFRFCLKSFEYVQLRFPNYFFVIVGV